MLGAGEVVLAYPAKLAGAPTVPSRFIQRLAAVAGETRWEAALERGERYLALGARARPARRASRGRCRGPSRSRARDARPTSLSVTEIETWLRDPYSIYARHVLQLQPLDAIDTPPGARDRGTVIHGAIGNFTTQFKDALPDDAVGELIKLGEQEFAVLEDFPEATAFWWPRFLRIARWFADFETRAPRQPDRASARRSAPSSRSRSATAPSRCARAPTASSICATAATPSSTTRPAGRRPGRRCRPG